MENKIGILTFSYPENMNFGAIIQAFALYSFIESLGYTPYIIDYYENKKKKLLPPKYRPRRLIGMKKFSLFFENHFKNKTPRCSNKADLIRNCKDFDTIIVGSDQVWRYRWLKEKINHYFLDFCNNKTNKVSYAASFGIDEWNEAPDYISSNIKNLINNFNYISVREKSGLDICKNTFGVKAKHTLDPTLLLNEDNYNKILTNNIIENDFIGCMILGKKKHHTDTIKFIEKKLNIKRKNIIGKVYLKNLIRYNSVSEWLSLIKNAKFIITNSFHCTVFAIIFKKDFICIGDKSRGVSRLTSLLEMFNLNDRLILSYDEDVIKEIISKHINYKDIDYSKYEEKYNLSKEFIINAINKN